MEFKLALLGLLVLGLPALLVAAYLAIKKRPILVEQHIVGAHGEAVTVRVLNCGTASVSQKHHDAGHEARGLCAVPLLLSVLAGRLALVGVRPRFESPGQERPAEPRGNPGMFGMWKLARGDEDGDSKDSEYLAGWSLSLDVKIMARCMLRRETG